MSRILVIGDSCRDTHVYGSSKRLCPDAPVPIFVPGYERQNLGMAGNVYQNLISLGLPATLKTNSVFVEKRRFIDEETNHLLLRIDSGEENIDRVVGLTEEFLRKFKLVVISDYNKGFLFEEDIQFICENHDVVFIDTKKAIGNYCSRSTFIKINKYEFEKSIDFIEKNSWCREKIITTLNDRGCSYKGETFPVEKVIIKDLSGAGDTFLAGLAAEYLSSRCIKKAIIYANECATKVVQMKGINTLNGVER